MDPSFETTFFTYAVPAFALVMCGATFMLCTALDADQLLLYQLLCLWMLLASWGGAAVAAYTGWFLYKKPFGWMAHLTHRSEAPVAYMFNIAGMVVMPPIVAVILLAFP